MRKQTKHLNKVWQKAKTNEYITTQLEQINKKLGNVMQKDDEGIGRMIEKIVEKTKA